MYKDERLIVFSDAKLDIENVLNNWLLIFLEAFIYLCLP